jgi:hypothetical protein
LPCQIELGFAQSARQIWLGRIKMVEEGRSPPGGYHSGFCGRAVLDGSLHLIGMVFGGLRHAHSLARHTLSRQTGRRS